MNLKSTETLPLFWPFRGLGYFLSHPSLWRLTLFSLFIFSALLVGLFILGIFIFWPESAVDFGHKILLILKAFGLAAAGVLIGFIVLMPFVITLVLDKLVRKVLLLENESNANVTFLNSFYSSTVVFFKTFFWRLFWPVVGVLSALFLGPVGVFISQLGIGHLAAIDGVDLVLALKGNSTKVRIEYYKMKRADIFCFGFFAAILSLILSVTIIGWLLWIPAVFCGVTLWVKDWPKLKV